MWRLATLAGLTLLAAGVVVIAVGTTPVGSALAPAVLAQAEPATEPANLGYDQVEIPFFMDWVRSGHADLTAEAFLHWQEEDPPLVPEGCAQCHAQAGHLDYIGADGSAAGVVDAKAEPGVIGCTTCHNDVAVQRTEVEMPSGALLVGLGREASCMTCHQGRASGVTVTEAIQESAASIDEVMEEQGFINIHYYAAAATLYGSEAGGWYQYEGAYYEPRFDHAEEIDTCQSCHDPHTLEVRVEQCASCHEDVKTKEDLRAIRMNGSLVDYDGDGDIESGIATEIANLQALLYDALKAYAVEVVGTPLAYDAHAYPYFFVDQNGDGVATPDEANYGGRYQSWTPRLLGAAYNYQASKKDPGAYAHNAKYVIQVLHDSILDLASATSQQVAPARPAEGGTTVLASMPVVSHMGDLGLRRDDAAHFDASGEPWRHWDEEGAVPASCSTCHSADGLPFAIEHGVQIDQPLSQGMECTTCHLPGSDFAVLENEDVDFPSGAVLSFGNSGDNLCAECHQGRASTATVDDRIGVVGDDEMADGLGFVNVHYFAAAATRFGGEAQGGYQYADQEYLGLWPHDEDVATCTSCHDPHNQVVDIAATCSDCHDGTTVADVRDYREWDGDFDGDGDTGVGTYYEIANMVDLLYAAIQYYARETLGTPIVYDSHSYPYFFVDANGDGVATPDEATYAGRYTDWTPRLMRAAYNFQYVQKDTGAYVHNSQYVVQLLHDSIEDLGGDVSEMDRPAADLF